jgi:hypothetical protein
LHPVPQDVSRTGAKAQSAEFSVPREVCIHPQYKMSACFQYEYSRCTRWFKYDRDYLCVNKSQFVPVIFEPPCMWTEGLTCSPTCVLFVHFRTKNVYVICVVVYIYNYLESNPDSPPPFPPWADIALPAKACEQKFSVLQNFIYCHR